jgi:photosystem II stability/assembly factor-like uncharacterized protein
MNNSPIRRGVIIGGRGDVVAADDLGKVLEEGVVDERVVFAVDEADD